MNDVTDDDITFTPGELAEIEHNFIARLAAYRWISDNPTTLAHPEDAITDAWIESGHIHRTTMDDRPIIELTDAGRDRAATMGISR